MTQTQIIGIIAAATSAVVCLVSLTLSAFFPNESWLQTVLMLSLGALLNSFSPSVLPLPQKPPGV
jgi:hypothetical protein